MTQQTLGGFKEVRAHVIDTGLQLHLGAYKIYRGRYGDVVVVAGKPTYKYLGRIDRDGTFVPNGNAKELGTEDKRELWGYMTRLRLGLTGFLKHYGDKTNHCGICGIKLTNDESKRRGYGPTCASKHGLPYGET